MNHPLMAMMLLCTLASAGAARAQSAAPLQGGADALSPWRGISIALGKRDDNRPGLRDQTDLGSGLRTLLQFEIRYEPDTIDDTAGLHTRPRLQDQGQGRVGLHGGFGMSRQGEDGTPFHRQTRAWLTGLDYTLGTNRFLLTYGQTRPDGFIKTRQMSFGYKYSF